MGQTQVQNDVSKRLESQDSHAPVASPVPLQKEVKIGFSALKTSVSCPPAPGVRGQRGSLLCGKGHAPPSEVSVPALTAMLRISGNLHRG